MSRLAAPTVFLDAFAADPSSRGVSIAIRAAAVLLMTGLIAAAAQVSFSIPFTTIPFTMQPMLVLMTGMALGARLGTSAQVLYLAAGIAGLPVFAASATLPMGAARLLGPTGGYLLAYPIAAFVCGWLAERGMDRRYSVGRRVGGTGGRMDLRDGGGILSVRAGRRGEGARRRRYSAGGVATVPIVRRVQGDPAYSLRLSG